MERPAFHVAPSAPSPPAPTRPIDSGSDLGLKLALWGLLAAIAVVTLGLVGVIVLVAIG